jgi:hypothetical protein
MDRTRLRLLMFLLVAPPLVWTADGEESLGDRFVRTQDAMKALTRELRIPEHFKEKDAKKKVGEFDPGTFFSVLKHINMEPGYRLDYVYHFDGIGGYPVLYARKAEEPPYTTETELIGAVRVKARLGEVEKIHAARRELFRSRELSDREAVAQAAGDLDRRLSEIPEREYWKWYLEHVQIDGTPDGYLEFMAFQMLAGRFCLYWHANRPDDRILTGPSSLGGVFDELKRFHLEPPGDLRAEAERLDFAPTVSMGDEEVRVSVVTFTKWGGFQRRTHTISARFPHKVVKEENRVLLSYECNMRF